MKGRERVNAGVSFRVASALGYSSAAYTSELTAEYAERETMLVYNDVL